MLMKLTFIGADHEVTGSCHFLEVGDTKVLIDCGMEQGNDVYENQELPIPASEVDYILVLMMVCILLLTGCSESKDTDEDDMIKAEESSGISAVSLVIGSDNYEPYNYIDESGENVGIDVDIAKEACRRLGITPVFKQITWDRKDSFLDSNEIDCLWGSFTMSIL